VEAQVTISRLHNLRGAQWCTYNKSILLEAKYYHSHTAVSTLSSSLTSIVPYLQNKHCFFQSKDHPKDAEFLNLPIANYEEIQTIFSFGLAIGKFAMGLGVVLDMPLSSSSLEDADKRESDTVILDTPSPH
jgi:hypothetical protein